MADSWSNIPLEELVNPGTPITYGVVKPGPAPADGVLFVRSGDLVGGHISISGLRTISHEVSEQYQRTQLKGGELLIALVGQPGATAIAPPELAGANIARQVGRVQLTNDVDKHYVKFFLSSEEGRRRLMRRTFGSVQQVINLRDLKQVGVTLPPLGEQRKIAAILSSVDEAIERTQAVIDQVQVVKKGLMQQLLTRGLPGRHTRFKQTEFGEIPAEWDYVPLSAVVESCIYGLNEKLTPSGGGIPVLRMGNLQQGEIVLDQLKYLPESTMLDPDMLLRRGEIMFNRTNSYDLVGKVGLVRKDMDVSFASYLLRIRPREGSMHGEWLAYALGSDLHQRRLRAMATRGVSQSNINRTKLMSLSIPVPPCDEQESHMEVLDSLHQRLAEEDACKLRLNELKQALMSVLLTGELRVPPDPGTTP